MLVIFLTVFIDLIGFGIVVPMIPVFSRHFGASPFLVGVIVASFSAMQFIFSPIWGKLSDRYGRRPILLISTAGAAVSYVIFALSAVQGNLWLLLASRLFAGACGGNITVAQAYVADIFIQSNYSSTSGNHMAGGGNSNSIFISKQNGLLKSEIGTFDFMTNYGTQSITTTRYRLN